jgi:hypothetical protein
MTSLPPGEFSLISPGTKNAGQVTPTTASYYEGTNVLVLRNQAGSLKATPLLSSALTLDATNSIRKLFIDYRQETITALMAEAILVPEGRFDFEWLNRLVGITETQEAWHEDLDTIPFGTSVGVVPTQDGRVKESVGALIPLHSRIVALVDGDADGDRYINELLSGATCPSAILQWPAGWTIEDAIVWIMSASPNAIPQVAAELGLPIGDQKECRDFLIRPYRNGGIKDDLIAHGNIATVIASNPVSLARARKLLSSLRNAITAADSEVKHFTLDNRSTAITKVRVFVVS